MSRGLQRFIYQLLLWLLLPFAVHLGRRLDRQSGQKRWKERFGRYPAPAPEQSLWLHAASVGEARAAGLLIDALRAGGYGGAFVVTTTTPTGAASIVPFLQDGDQHLYAPYDLAPIVSRALDHIQPALLVVLEVEIWPQLWKQCQQRGIGIVMANARMAERSLQRYQKKLPSLWQDTLARAQLILAQSETVCARFRCLGVDESRLQIGGNLKFSQSVEAAVVDKGRALRQQLSPARPVWVAASTHEGEEQIALDCHRQLLRQHPDLLLVIVPRHPQRFDAVAGLCRQSGLSWCRRSDGDPKEEREALTVGTQVYLADTLGELLSFFVAADLSWVAGSFADVGGHNILEPAAYGCPVVVGPKMRNFAEIMAEFLQRQALVQVQTPAELTTALDRLINSESQRRQLADNAETLLQDHRQAAALQSRAILENLPG